jgi:hypothetical protein
MKTQLQQTVYFWDDINRLITAVESAYLSSKNGREDPTDGFMDFTRLLRNYFSKNSQHSYFYEHVKRYAENLRNVLGNNCNELAFRSVAEIFDFYGRGY